MNENTTKNTFKNCENCGGVREHACTLREQTNAYTGINTELQVRKIS